MQITRTFGYLQPAARSADAEEAERAAATRPAKVPEENLRGTKGGGGRGVSCSSSPVSVDEDCSVGPVHQLDAVRLRQVPDHIVLVHLPCRQLRPSLSFCSATESQIVPRSSAERLAGGRLRTGGGDDPVEGGAQVGDHDALLLPEHVLPLCRRFVPLHLLLPFPAQASTSPVRNPAGRFSRCAGVVAARQWARGLV